MAGSRSLMPSMRMSRVSPMARPPKKASATLGAGPSRQEAGTGRAVACRPLVRVNESASMHNPPNSMIWASVSLNVFRLVYCSGRLMARTRAPAGAQRPPASRPTRPAKASTAAAPMNGAMATAASGPPDQTPMARIMGSPAMNWGTIVPPDWKKPRLPKVMPACGPPNAGSDSGMWVLP